MNAIATLAHHRTTDPQPLAILGTTIRRDAEGRYCLNDCHRASGGEKRNGPGYWRVTDTAISLVAELAGDTGNPVGPLRVLNDGRNNGTYVVKELVYAYAMWISPAFHLQVIRAFDALVTGRAAPVSQPALMSRTEALRLALEQSERADREEERADQAEAERDVARLIASRASAAISCPAG